MGTESAGEIRLRRLYAEHGSMLLAYSTRLCNGDRQRGEDIVQETLVRAWRHPLPAGATADAERAWLMTVARNVAIDGFRARSSRPQEVGGDALEMLDQQSDENAIDRAVEQWTVAEALTALSPDHRAVLIETFFRGRSVAEAAAVLGIPQGTVKSRAFHAVRALRRNLALKEVLA
jgi:RNA polymerase sigma-70 factor (ECF subfamily)